MATPSASRVLRRALLVWGAGHLALGLRRGWLLVGLELISLVLLAMLAMLLIEGTRWLAVLLAVIGFIVAWIAQALDAHRRALAAGGAAGGEMQLAALLPIVVGLLGGFWLVGGYLGSPAATLQHYVSAWQAGQPSEALALLDEPVDGAALGAEWSAGRQQLEMLVDAAARRYGSQSGLDPRLPFNSLRFEEVVAERRAGRAVIAVYLVRRERFETELFGIIPTAAQRTIAVRQLGVVRLHAEPAPTPAWWPATIGNPSRVWLIDEVALDLSAS